MKAKQVPDDYWDWIKARTFVIGGEAARELDPQRAAQNARSDGKGSYWTKEKLRRQHFQATPSTVASTIKMVGIDRPITQKLVDTRQQAKILPVHCIGRSKDTIHQPQAHRCIVAAKECSHSRSPRRTTD
jgi:hypothetical protein